MPLSGLPLLPLKRLVSESFTLDCDQMFDQCLEEDDYITIPRFLGKTGTPQCLEILDLLRFTCTVIHTVKRIKSAIVKGIQTNFYIFLFLIFKCQQPPISSRSVYIFLPTPYLGLILLTEAFASFLGLFNSKPFS